VKKKITIIALIPLILLLSGCLEQEILSVTMNDFDGQIFEIGYIVEEVKLEGSCTPETGMWGIVTLTDPDGVEYGPYEERQLWPTEEIPQYDVLVSVNKVLDKTGLWTITCDYKVADENGWRDCEITCYEFEVVDLTITTCYSCNGTELVTKEFGGSDCPAGWSTEVLDCEQIASVPGDETTEDEVLPTPGFEFPLVLISSLIVLFIWRRKNEKNI